MGIAVAHSLQWPLDAFDITCGTSLIKALGGDKSAVKDGYLLQRFRGVVCCLTVPCRKHNADDAGHAVERLLCGTSAGLGSFEMVTSLRVGDLRFLVTSEVDACDGDGRVVELKSSSVASGMGMAPATTALQVAVNGSDFVLACSLDADKSQLEAVRKIPADEVLSAREAALVAYGRRVRLLAARVMEYMRSEARGSDVGGIVRLTFDESKAPCLEPAGEGVEVLPRGLR